MLGDTLVAPLAYFNQSCHDFPGMAHSKKVNIKCVSYTVSTGYLEGHFCTSLPTKVQLKVFMGKFTVSMYHNSFGPIVLLLCVERLNTEVLRLLTIFQVLIFITDKLLVFSSPLIYASHLPTQHGDLLVCVGICLPSGNPVPAGMVTALWVEVSGVPPQALGWDAPQTRPLGGMHHKPLRLCTLHFAWDCCPLSSNMVYFTAIN